MHGRKVEERKHIYKDGIYFASKETKVKKNIVLLQIGLRNTLFHRKL